MKYKINKKLNKKVVEGLDTRTDDEIDEELKELITAKMNDEQFWDYVKSWYSTDNIVEDIMNWDTDVKKEAIDEINEKYFNSKENVAEGLNEHPIRTLDEAIEYLQFLDYSVGENPQKWEVDVKDRTLTFQTNEELIAWAKEERDKSLC